LKRGARRRREGRVFQRLVITWRSSAFNAAKTLGLEPASDRNVRATKLLLCAMRLGVYGLLRFDGRRLNDLPNGYRAITTEV
jgi:acetaldehyde dehydrogenase (acetylating)